MSVPSVQRVYARWLDWTGRGGLAVLVAAFIAYASGLLEAHVPLEQLPGLWTRPLPEYLALTGAPTGWRWLELLPKGDYMSLAGVALLALATLACYVRLAVAFLRSGERLHLALAAAQILVLLGAALNLFGGGH